MSILCNGMLRTLYHTLPACTLSNAILLECDGCMSATIPVVVHVWQQCTDLQTWQSSVYLHPAASAT